MKPIPDFPGYSITEDGRVWSHLRRNRHQIETGWMKPNYASGKATVQLRHNGRYYCRTIASLILRTYVDSSGRRTKCKDGDSENVRLENLAWRPKTPTPRVKRRHRNHEPAALRTFGDFISAGAAHLDVDSTALRDRITALLAEKRLSVRDIELYINRIAFTQAELAERYGLTVGKVCWAQMRVRRAWPELGNDTRERVTTSCAVHVQSLDCSYQSNGDQRQDLMDESRMAILCGDPSPHEEPDDTGDGPTYGFSSLGSVYHAN